MFIQGVRNFTPPVSGAFYEAGGYSYFAPSDGVDARVINFDASRCSSIYGNTNHVTPTNLTYKIWKRIN